MKNFEVKYSHDTYCTCDAFPRLFVTVLAVRRHWAESRLPELLCSQLCVLRADLLSGAVVGLSESKCEFLQRCMCISQQNNSEPLFMFINQPKIYKEIAVKAGWFTPGVKTAISGVNSYVISDRDRGCAHDCQVSLNIISQFFHTFVVINDPAIPRGFRTGQALFRGSCVYDFTRYILAQVLFIVSPLDPVTVLQWSRSW